MYILVFWVMTLCNLVSACQIVLLPLLGWNWDAACSFEMLVTTYEAVCACITHPIDPKFVQGDNRMCNKSEKYKMYGHYNTVPNNYNLIQKSNIW